MAGFWQVVRKTSGAKHLFFVRYAAAAPLGVFGIMHLTMADASISVPLSRAGVPLVGLNSVLIPAVEIIIAFLLATGFFARLAAAAGAIVMSGALYAHMVADWEDEMTWLVPVAVLLCCLYTLWRGAGEWSADRALSQLLPVDDGKVRTLHAEDVEEHRPRGGDGGRSAPA